MRYDMNSIVVMFFMPQLDNHLALLLATWLLPRLFSCQLVPVFWEETNWFLSFGFGMAGDCRGVGRQLC